MVESSDIRCFRLPVYIIEAERYKELLKRGCVDSRDDTDLFCYLITMINLHSAMTEENQVKALSIFDFRTKVSKEFLKELGKKSELKMETPKE
jgi:hypothetical protein